MPVMLKLLETDSGTDEVLKCLGQIGPKAKAAVPALIKYMNGGKHENRITTLDALKAIEEPQRLVPQLVAEFEKNGIAGDWGLGFERDCVDYFGKQGAHAKEVVPFLVKGMESHFGHAIFIQMPYIEALGGIGPAAQEALPALEKIARGSDEQLRTAANKAIMQIKSAK